jgi:hypothetical protein
MGIYWDEAVAEMITAADEVSLALSSTPSPSTPRLAIRSST